MAIFATRSAMGRLTRISAACALVLAVATPVLAADDDVVARINDKVITNADVDVALQIFDQQLAQAPEGARRGMVIDALVDMYVMADAAEKAGLDQSPTYQQRMAFLSAQALRNTYIEESIQKSVTEDDLKARYQKDVAGYTPPEEVHARHILVEKKEDAEQIIKDLAGGADFAAIAKEKSQDPGSKDNGGDLGFFTKGQMVPEFEQEAFTLAPGETSKAPIQTQFGFHIIRVDEKRSQPVPTFEEVREQIVQVVQREKFQEVLTKLKADAKIEMVEKPAEPAVDAPATDAPAADAPAADPAQ